MDFLQFIQQSWVYIAAIIGGVTLVWNFVNKTLKDIIAGFKRPFDDLDAKIDSLGTKIDETKHHNSVVSRALLSMQRNSLLRSCEEYLRKGYATMNERQTISEQFTSYSELGGNHFIADMVAQVMKLPYEPPADDLH